MVFVLTTSNSTQVASQYPIQRQNTYMNSGSLENVTTISDCTQEFGEHVMSDEFVSAPFGFNSSLWTLTTHQNPTLTWTDGESLVLNSEMFKFATLESLVETGPGVIVEFNASFTKGQSYFGIGWADEYQDSQDEWISNLRVCQNGVFIDYWDKDLFLVTYRDGRRVAIGISNINITEEHQYTLVWSESLVRVCIDDIEHATSSMHIPSVDLPLIITTSGHHYRVGHDQLIIDRIAIYTRELSQLYTYPRISLLWPENTSTVFSYDEIDLEIEGELGVGYYSWDGEANSTFLAPWDIKVPTVQGLHNLEVCAENAEGGWSSAYLEFTVIIEELSLSTPDLRLEPLIDGIVSGEEQRVLTKVQSSLRGEDRIEIPFVLYLGYFNESLYIAAVTTLQDRYHSSISLFVDGEGNGIWGDSELGSEIHDICITSPTPRAGSVGTITQKGHEVNPVGVVYDCGLNEAGVTAEFLIPVDSVGGNSSLGLGIGIVVSHGGFNSYYPAGISLNEMSALLIIKSSGLISTVLMDGVILTLGAVGCLLIVAGYISVRTKRPHSPIEERLADEQLERIRILLHSHPEISIDRLALLANTDTVTVKTSIDMLVERNLLAPPIENSGRRVVRSVLSSEKKQK
jgi:hypothetical protein